MALWRRWDIHRRDWRSERGSELGVESGCGLVILRRRHDDHTWGKQAKQPSVYLGIGQHLHPTYRKSVLARIPSVFASFALAEAVAC